MEPPVDPNNPSIPSLLLLLQSLKPKIQPKVHQQLELRINAVSNTMHEILQDLQGLMQVRIRVVFMEFRRKKKEYKKELR